MINGLLVLTFLQFYHQYFPMRSLLFLFLLSVFAGNYSHAQTSASSINVKHPVLQTASPESVGISSERLKRVDSNLSQWVNSGRTNACVALIVRNGKIAYQKAFGYNDPEKKQPMRTDEIFRIASQTKAITSVAV